MEMYDDEYKKYTARLEKSRKAQEFLDKSYDVILEDLVPEFKKRWMHLSGKNSDIVLRDTLRDLVAEVTVGMIKVLVKETNEEKYFSKSTLDSFLDEKYSSNHIIERIDIEKTEAEEIRSVVKRYILGDLFLHPVCIPTGKENYVIVKQNDGLKIIKEGDVR